MSDVYFISVAEAFEIHKRVILEHGGDPGLRDRGLLESALSMPHASFSGEYLHPSLPEMAAAYHFHLCSNQPFVDRNKRVAVATAEVFLIINGHELTCSDDELEELTIGVAAGETAKEEVIRFFQEFVKPE